MDNRNSNRELKILDFLRERMPGDAAFASLGDRYADIVDAVMDSRFDEYSKRLWTEAAYLTALAGIASFLALVEIGFIVVVGNPDCDTSPTPAGCDPHSILLRNLVIFLSYIALSFDSLGAIFSLLAARTLLDVNTLSQDLLDAKHSLGDSILRHTTNDDGPNPSAQNPTTSTPASAALEACRQEAQDLLERILRHRHLIEHHTGGRRIVISFILLGMQFLFVALILRVITTQPRALSIPLIACITGMVGTLAWKEKRAHPRVWANLRGRLWTRKRTRQRDEDRTIFTGNIAFVVMLLLDLLVALNQTILTTALPRIASDFGSFTMQGWVATSFVLSKSVFLLFYGEVLVIFPAKWVLIFAITTFEVGSLVCGVSQNVNQLIAGRAVSGLGAAGMSVTTLHIVTLSERPPLFGRVNAGFYLSSIIGPLIGGVFTDHVTWRWCFFINLPIGGISVAAVVFLIKALPPLDHPAKRSWKDIIQQVARMDFVGAILVAGAITTITLSLQWGGNTKAWDDKAVITCFVLAGVLTGAFISWEIRLEYRAMIPTAIGRLGCTMFCHYFFTSFSFPLFSYYIPIFYQVVRHHSATKSGVDLLPFMLAVSSSLPAALVVFKMGYLWHFRIVGPVFLAVGSGLFYTLNTNSSSAKIIGFQILAGVGTGMSVGTLLGMQLQVVVGNCDWRGKLLRTFFFAQLLGGTMGLSVAEAVFASELRKHLLRFAPNAPATIVRESPTTIYTDLPPAMIPGVVRAYTESLRVVFVLGVPVAGLAWLALIVGVFIDNSAYRVPKKGTRTTPWSVGTTPGPGFVNVEIRTSPLFTETSPGLVGTTSGSAVRGRDELLTQNPAAAVSGIGN